MHLLNQRFIAQANCTRWFEFNVIIFKVDLNDTNLILLSDPDMSGTMQFSSKTQSVWEKSRMQVVSLLLIHHMMISKYPESFCALC